MILSDVPNKDAVHAMMRVILDSINQVFQDEDVTLPDRQFTSVGAVPHDCEQLYISFVQMYLGPVGAEADEAQNCDSPRTAVMQIQLVRCIPRPTQRGAPPAAEVLDESTQQLTADAWLLMDGVGAANDALDRPGMMADVSVTDASGGYQAVQLNLSMMVP